MLLYTDSEDKCGDRQEGCSFAISLRFLEQLETNSKGLLQYLWRISVQAKLVHQEYKNANRLQLTTSKGFEFGWFTPFS